MMQNMKLQTKISLLLSFFFILFTMFVWLLSKEKIEQYNQIWAQRFTQNQVIFDKSRTLLPIMREVKLAQELSKNPEIIKMALNDDNSTIRQKGLAVFEHYRLHFQDRSYFAAFVKTNHYYFNDYSNQFMGKELRYTLSPQKKEDAWFYKAVNLKDEYQINVNIDTELKTTKVWINFLLRDHNKVIGIIGTGLTLDQFLKESVNIEQKGIQNIFVNQDLEIQLERDSNLINFASLVNEADKNHSLSMIFKNFEDTQKIKQAMLELKHSSNHNDVKTLWITYEGKKQLVGIAYLKELGWYSITKIDSQNLVLADSLNIFAILTTLFLILMIALNWILRKNIISPLDNLKETIQKMGSGNYSFEESFQYSGEMADVAKSFHTMAKTVNEYQNTLEEKVRLRTQELKKNQHIFHTIADNIDAYIYIKDMQYRYVYVNKYVEKFFEKPMEEIIGKDDHAFFDDDICFKIHKNDKKVLENGERVRDEELSFSKNGSMFHALSPVKVPLYNEEGEIYALCGISIDITERKKMEDEIKNLAFYDTLTKLPNRRLINDRLDQAIEFSAREGKCGALLFLDLDNFKPLNDLHGHNIGDLLLIEAARRIEINLRAIDTVGRFGGDEYIIILNTLSQDKDSALKDANNVALKIAKALNEPYVLVSKEKEIMHHCSVSIGIALFCERIESETIMKWADMAMYEAKDAGKNKIYFYEA